MCLAEENIAVVRRGYDEFAQAAAQVVHVVGEAIVGRIHRDDRFEL